MIVLVPTVASVHRLVFPHPSKLQRTVSIYGYILSFTHSRKIKKASCAGIGPIMYCVTEFCTSFLLNI